MRRVCVIVGDGNVLPERVHGGAIDCREVHRRIIVANLRHRTLPALPATPHAEVDHMRFWRAQLVRLEVGAARFLQNAGASSGQAIRNVHILHNKFMRLEVQAGVIAIANVQIANRSNVRHGVVDRRARKNVNRRSAHGALTENRVIVAIEIRYFSIARYAFRIKREIGNDEVN